MRLYKEWVKLDTFCSMNEAVSYRMGKRTPAGLPVEYELMLHIRSITGVLPANEEGLQYPVFGAEHRLRITLPNNYPSADGGYPVFRFLTDVWHPNIRFYGEFKGRVCLNQQESGTFSSLCDFTERIIAYLTYADYHARDEYPYPEDQTVARWVLEQAEPQGWLHFHSVLH